MSTGRDLAVALVGPFPPPYGGMSVYLSAIEAALLQEGMTPRRVLVPYAAVGGRRRDLRRLATFGRAALTVLGTRPDVVHCVTGSQPNLVGNMLPLIAAQFARRPSILSIAGGEFPAAVTAYRGARRRLVQFILTRPRLLVACTDDIADALRVIGIPDARIIMLSNALPLRLDPRAGQSIPPEVAEFAATCQPLIASISGWYALYGSQDLVQAVRLLRATHPRLGLVLMVKGGGDAAYRAELLETLADGGLRDAVLVREDERAVFPILCGADVFVRTPHHEGDAISVRESLAVGTPVVASDVGFRPAGVVRYRPGDPMDLAARLRQVLDGHPDGARADGDEGEQNLQVLISAYRRLSAHTSSPDRPGGSRLPGLGWYIGRAATMTPREIVWRAGRLTDTSARRGGWRASTDARMLGASHPDWDALLQRFRDGIGRPVLLDRARARRIVARQPADVRAALAAADAILSGERAYFGYPTVNVGRQVDWSYDPIADYRWPTTAGNRIDHQVAAGDPKWIWELNRLQHLPVLAQAWLFTGESHYAEAAFDHLDSWLDQNPTAGGTMWRAPFEVGVRAISIAIAMQGLRDAPGMTTQRYRRVARMLDASARFCWQERSRFSSANNHLIGELTGLVTVHLLFPELVLTAALFGRAMESLADAAASLVLPDGAGAEQSISYQIFTAELMSIVVALMRLRGGQAPARIDAAIDRSAQYLLSVVGSGDPDPRYGDDDDGFALRLGAEPKRTVRDHLGIVAATGSNRSAARFGEMTLTAAWLADGLGTSAGDFGAGVRREESDASLYAPDGGLVVLRPGTYRLTMDVGPLGYLSTAAHGHADALAVTLSAAGRDLIVDPGTGSYCGKPNWRTVHRGTRAHATVCVDGVCQSVMGGPFYWRKHAVTTVHSVDLGRGIVDAEHDGYRRLDDPVTHRRWLIAPPGEATAVVIDLLEGQSSHDVTVSWPLHPELDSMPTDSGHLVTREGQPVLQLAYAATSVSDTAQVRADVDSQLGWWSDRLESRTPAWLVTARVRAPLPVAVLSVLRTVDAGVITAPVLVRAGPLLEASWSEYGVLRRLTIDTERPGGVFSTPRWYSERLVSRT